MRLSAVMCHQYTFERCKCSTTNTLCICVCKLWNFIFTSSLFSLNLRGIDIIERKIVVFVPTLNVCFTIYYYGDGDTNIHQNINIGCDTRDWIHIWLNCNGIIQHFRWKLTFVMYTEWGNIAEINIAVVVTRFTNLNSTPNSLRKISHSCTHKTITIFPSPKNASGKMVLFIFIFSIVCCKAVPSYGRSLCRSIIAHDDGVHDLTISILSHTFHINGLWFIWSGRKQSIASDLMVLMTIEMHAYAQKITHKSMYKWKSEEKERKKSAVFKHTYVSIRVCVWCERILDYSRMSFQAHIFASCLI